MHDPKLALGQAALNGLRTRVDGRCKLLAGHRKDFADMFGPLVKFCNQTAAAVIHAVEFTDNPLLAFREALLNGFGAFVECRRQIIACRCNQRTHALGPLVNLRNQAGAAILHLVEFSDDALLAIGEALLNVDGALIQRRCEGIAGGCHHRAHALGALVDLCDEAGAAIFHLVEFGNKALLPLGKVDPDGIRVFLEHCGKLAT